MVIIMKALFKTNTTHSSQATRWPLFATRAVRLTVSYYYFVPSGHYWGLLSRVLALTLITSHEETPNIGGVKQRLHLHSMVIEHLQIKEKCNLASI